MTDPRAIGRNDGVIAEFAAVLVTLEKCRKWYALGVIVEPPQRFIAAFNRAGWFKGRGELVDASINPKHPAAAVLAAFGGLRLSIKEGGISSVGFGPVELNSTEKRWAKWLDSELVGIGDADEHACLAVDGLGRMFVFSWVHDAAGLVGDDITIALLTLLSGARCRPMLGPGQREMSWYGEQIRAGDPALYDWAPPR